MKASRVVILFLILSSAVSYCDKNYHSIYHELEEDFDDDILWNYTLPAAGQMPDYSAKTIDQELIYAASHPTDNTLVPLLLVQGANPNYQWHPSIQTPIYLASYFGNLNNVIALINAGADPNLGEGALSGVLRGIFEKQFEQNIQYAYKMLIFLLDNGADHTAGQVQDLISVNSDLKHYLIFAMQQSNTFKKPNKSA